VGISAYILLTMNSHGIAAAEAFRAQVLELDEVLECQKLTGEADMILKVATRDLASFNHLLTRQILGSPEVATARSSIILEDVKSTTALPLGFAGAVNPPTERDHQHVAPAHGRRGLRAAPAKPRASRAGRRAGRDHRVRSAWSVQRPARRISDPGDAADHGAAPPVAPAPGPRRRGAALGRRQAGVLASARMRNWCASTCSARPARTARTVPRHRAAAQQARVRGGFRGEGREMAGDSPLSGLYDRLW
jgi:hypothetical protein